MLEGLPSEADIDKITIKQKHVLIVLDDLLHRVGQSPEMELLFTQGCHHSVRVSFITCLEYTLFDYL